MADINANAAPVGGFDFRSLINMVGAEGMTWAKTALDKSLGIQQPINAAPAAALATPAAAPAADNSGLMKWGLIAGAAVLVLVLVMRR